MSGATVEKILMHLPDFKAIWDIFHNKGFFVCLSVAIIAIYFIFFDKKDEKNNVIFPTPKGVGFFINSPACTHAECA